MADGAPSLIGNSDDSSRYYRARCAGCYHAGGLRPCGWSGPILRGSDDAPTCPQCGGYTLSEGRTSMLAVPAIDCRCSLGVTAADCPDHGW